MSGRSIKFLRRLARAQNAPSDLSHYQKRQWKRLTHKQRGLVRTATEPGLQMEVIQL